MQIIALYKGKAMTSSKLLSKQMEEVISLASL